MGDAFLANNRVDFIYTLQDGTRVSRRFWRMDAACLEALLRLDHSNEFDEMLRYTLGLPARLASATWVGYSPPPKVEDAPISLRLPDGKIVWPELNESTKHALLQTLYEELSAQTLQQRYFPEGQEAMTLYLPLGEEERNYGDDIKTEGDPYGYYHGGRELALALYPAQFPKAMAILKEAGSDASQNANFVRAVGFPARVFLQKSTSFDYGPPPAVFYAFTGAADFQQFAFIPQLTNLQSDITDSAAIASLYQNSTTQTSYARNGYLVWFIRVDNSAICRFVEEAEFNALVK